MEKIKEAKERIINAAIELFSQKGYDATRVSDIADSANVNKALIYYYFRNKQDILDYMVNSLFNNTMSFALDFIRNNILQMKNNGYLEIRPDRLHFINRDALKNFMQNTFKCFEHLLDYVIEKKEIVRILMLESLKKGKHQNSLFRFMKFMSGNDVNLVLKNLSGKDQQLVYSDEIVLFKFFFSVIPIVSFAAYFDDYKAVSSLSDNELRSSFLHVYRIIMNSMVTENDILLDSGI